MKKTKAKKHTSLSLLSILTAAVLFVSCSKQEAESPLPQDILGMQLMKETKGEAAEAMLRRLHGKEVAPKESYVGHYGTGPEHAMLYISRFESDKQAQSVLNSMSSRIGKGSSGFGHHQQFDVDGKNVHLVLGQGRIHYFFAKGNNLLWLGIAPRMARAGLAQLLEVKIDKIPKVETVLSNL